MIYQIKNHSFRMKEFLLWMVGENSSDWMGPEKDSVEHI